MVGLIAGVGGALLNAFTQYQQNQRVKNVMGEMKAPDKSALNQAQLERNARMQGAAQAERNIYQSGANAMGKIQQSATSGADVMQAAAGISGQSNEAFQNLATQEGQNKAQANQAYLQALSNYQQQYNDYLQSKISGLSSFGQGQASAIGGLTSLAGGLMNNASYLKGREPGKDVNFWDLGYKK